MSRRRSGASLLVALVLACGACRPQPEPPDESPKPALLPTVEVTREDVIRDGRIHRPTLLRLLVDDVLLPDHEELVSQAESLARAVKRLEEAPTPETLTAAREQWLSAALAWKRVDVWEIGPVRDRNLQNRIWKWPVHADFIEDFIGGEERIDESFIASKGSSSVGFTALEYLLFDDVATDEPALTLLTTAPGAERRRRYASATAGRLAQRTKELRDIWSPKAEAYREVFAHSPDPVSLLVNEIVAALERILRFRLGEPLGAASGGSPRPERVEAERSETSLELIVATLDGVERAFTGGEGPGLEELVAESLPERDDLVPRLVAGLALVREELDRLPAPLHEAVVEDPTACWAAWNAVKDLLVLFKVELSGRLGLLIVWGDTDGD